MNRIKTIAIALTFIAILGYLYFTVGFLFDPIAHSNRPGIHLFNFFIWFTIPIVLWVIFFLGTQSKRGEKDTKMDIRAESHKDQNTQDTSIFTNNEYLDIEHHLLNDKIKNYSDDLKQYTEDLELLIRSLNQKLIDEEKFNSEKAKLETRISSVKESINYCEKRLKAIDILETELKDLENLCKKKIISVEDKDLKRREIIGDLIKTMD